jgi:glycosyltransferase involved in cell wall biosynthesis
MDIGFANISLGVRGSTRRLVELSNHLIRRGHKVTVYLPDGQTCSWLKLDAPIKSIDQMDEKNDYIIYYGHKELFPLMQKAKVKYRIYYILGLGDERVLNKEVGSKGIETIDRDGSPTVYHALHNKDTWKVFANCFALSDWIQTNLDCKAWTVQGGVDHNIFQRSRKPVAYKIVGSGAKRSAEGTVELLKTVKQVKREEKNSSYELYAGRGYSQEQLACILSSADVYLDTQKWGGWNNAVAEAMSVGAPTVCTRIMGNADFCENFYNCLMVDVDDINGMVDRVIKLLNDNELRSKVSKNAVKTMQTYTWENAAIQMEKALEEL